MIIFQAVFFFMLVYGLGSLGLMNVFLVGLSVVCALYIASGESHPVYRLAWVIVILLIPVVGGMFYIFFHKNRVDVLVE
ncbi:MAG: PLD nuclease N-terminal domain-containing protein, partial [Oscillospiraceae bacterium]|nr:PLD nuclease N-terminal domain-containing protein [Oscillospiraceae bacterium]